jgi:8-oxo-dGTP pyrophosphatase MutT (NUDIX family)
MAPAAIILPDPLQLRAALHPLSAASTSRGWNQDELAGLLPDGVPLREAAVLVGLVPRPEGCQVLLTRRTDALRHHAGQVSFPGGRIEPHDSDVVAAAIRETREETGLEPGLIQPLGLLDPLCTITGFRVSPVVAMIDPGYVATPDPGEVDEVFEASLAFLLDPANLGEFVVEFGGRPRRVLEFVDRGDPRRRIWGATASILFNLRERLRAVDRASGARPD